MANLIKGQQKSSKDTPWPEIQVTNPPSCSADIFIQLVERKQDFSPQRHEQYVPSPNLLFVKKGNNWQRTSNGITILDEGCLDGKPFLGTTYLFAKLVKHIIKVEHHTITYCVFFISVLKF